MTKEEMMMNILPEQESDDGQTPCRDCRPSGGRARQLSAPNITLATNDVSLQQASHARSLPRDVWMTAAVPGPVSFASNPLEGINHSEMTKGSLADSAQYPARKVCSLSG
jgi:hypothetical protein